MPSLLLCALLLSASPSAASPPAEATSYAANRLDTLHDRPGPWGVRFTLAGSAPLSEHETDQVPGAPPEVSSFTSLRVGATVAVGLLDDLLVSLSESALLTHTQKFIAPQLGRAGDRSTRGPSDPALNVSYRFLGGLSGPYFSAIWVGWSPSLGHARPADPGQSGNDLRGGHAFWVQSQSDAVLGALEAQLTLTVEGFTRAEGDLSNPLYDQVVNGHVAGTLSPWLRYHVCDLLYVGAGADMVFPYTTTSRYIHAPAGLAPTWEVHHAFHVVPELEAGLTLTPDVVLSVAVDHSHFTNHADGYQLAVARESQTFDDWAASLRLKFAL